MFLKVLLFSLVLAAFLTEIQAKYSDCGSKKAVVQNVEIIPACGSVCNLYLGQDATFKLTFKTNQSSNSVTTKIEGLLLGIPAPFPLPDPESCNDGDLTCPMESDKVYHYERTFYVENYYPELFVNVRYRLIDENGVDIVCIKVPAKLQRH